MVEKYGDPPDLFYPKDDEFAKSMYLQIFPNSWRPNDGDSENGGSQLEENVNLDIYGITLIRNPEKPRCISLKYNWSKVQKFSSFYQKLCGSGVWQRTGTPLPIHSSRLDSIAPNFKDLLKTQFCMIPTFFQIGFHHSKRKNVKVPLMFDPNDIDLSLLKFDVEVVPVAFEENGNFDKWVVVRFLELPLSSSNAKKVTLDGFLAFPLMNREPQDPAFLPTSIVIHNFSS